MLMNIQWSLMYFLLTVITSLLSINELHVDLNRLIIKIVTPNKFGMLQKWDLTKENNSLFHCTGLMLRAHIYWQVSHIVESANKCKHSDVMYLAYKCHTRNTHFSTIIIVIIGAHCVLFFRHFILFCYILVCILSGTM